MDVWTLGLAAAVVATANTTARLDITSTLTIRPVPAMCAAGITAAHG